MSTDFAANDTMLIDVIKAATEEERMALSKIIADKYSSSIKEYEDNPYEIAKEIQLFGGNTAANVFRRHGVKYAEILRDIAEELEFDYKNAKTNTKVVLAIEDALLLHFKEDIDRAISKGKDFGTDSVKAVVVAEGAGFVLSRIGVAAIPVIGQALAAGLTFYQISKVTGPSFKTTIPCAIMIALLRKKYFPVVETQSVVAV